MKTITRLQLAMANSANAFCQAHPDPNPGGQAMADQLNQLVSHADALVQQQLAGQTTSAAATARKAELRATLGEHLAILVRLAQTASKSNAGITFHFRLPKGRVADASLLAAGRVALAEVAGHKELFTQLGMPDALLDQVTAELDEFEREGIRQRQAIAAQVGASAELDAVAREVLTHLKHVDALQRLRFSGQPELAAAWKSARNVAYPAQARTSPEPPKDEGQAA